MYTHVILQSNNSICTSWYCSKLVGIVDVKIESQIQVNTLASSFQMIQVHPPTVSRISLKKGDLSTQVIGPECAVKE